MRAQYGDVMLVLIRLGTNMAGNQRKHLALIFTTEFMKEYMNYWKKLPLSWLVDGL